MIVGEGHWRRSLAIELTRQRKATVEEILAASPSVSGSATRIGITGPPGAGKSSLICSVATRRLQRGRSVGVLAIDPSSPISEGSLLGDRIRMDAVVDAERLYIRSVPSGNCSDGLCPNVIGLLATYEQAGFDDVIMETVGVGQTNYEARLLVDKFVVVLGPNSGDIVQAMKAGILEVADIYVINKADLPAAEKLAAELRSVLGTRDGRRRDITSPIILTSNVDGRGIADLDAALDVPVERSVVASDETERNRRLYQLRALVEQRIRVVERSVTMGDLASAYEELVRKLHVPV